MSCVFCNRSDAHVCSSCVQKILFMPMDKIREAAVLAEQKGFTEKAEILNSYLEGFEDERTDIVAKSVVRGRRTRSLRDEKRPARQVAKHQRASLRQAVKHQSGVPVSRSSRVANAEP